MPRGRYHVDLRSISFTATIELATRMFGEHPELRTSNGLYTVSDCDDVVDVNGGTTIYAIGRADPDDPSAGLRVLRSFATTTVFAPVAFPGSPRP